MPGHVAEVRGLELLKLCHAGLRHSVQASSAVMITPPRESRPLPHVRPARVGRHRPERGSGRIRGVLPAPAAEAPRNSTSGAALGTMRRLEHVLVVKAGVTPQEAANLLRPWREVRRARQDPAHALRKNVADETLVRRQAQLLVDVVQSLVGIRNALTALPKNKDWAPESLLTRRVYQF